MANERDTATLEGENDLKQFLKVVQPDWSMPRRHRSSDINRVVKKLMDIGVRDSWDLMSRVTTNRINEDLSNAGYPRFSRETLDRIRKHGTFFRALENLTEANYRQVGVFSPVAQLLSKTNLKKQADKRRSERRLIGERIGPLDSGRTSAGPSRSSAMSGATSGFFDGERSGRGLQELSRSGTLLLDRSRTLSENGLRRTVSEGAFGDFWEGPPRLRGYRGEVRGTAAGSAQARPATAAEGASSLRLRPSVASSGFALSSGGSGGAAIAVSPPPSQPVFRATADMGGVARAASSPFSSTMTLAAAKTQPAGFFAGSGGADASLGGSSSLPAGRGALLIERARGGRTPALSSVDALERPGSPSTRLIPRGAWPVCLEAELQELAEVALLAQRSGGPEVLASAVEEAFDKLYRLGEEELNLMDPEKTFEEQDGTELQVFRIAAHYAKLGLDPLRVARTLQSPNLTLMQVRRQLDFAAVDRVKQVAESVALARTRASVWAGFARSAATPPTSAGAAGAGGGAGGSGALPAVGASGPGSPASTGSLLQPQAPPPTWKEKGWRSVDKYAEHMLREQHELQAKQRLYRVMEAEGKASPTRKFVAENIRARLMEERDHEAEKMEVQQTCNNIRRQILSIGNAKRELNNMRRTIEAEDPQSRTQFYKEHAEKSGLAAALAFNGFKKSQQS